MFLLLCAFIIVFLLCALFKVVLSVVEVTAGLSESDVKSMCSVIRFKNK